ncbi:DUF1217 domain-containing protein [Oceanicola sp. S124]|uniref:DUF1217 domain-containing protein n=1 Tax=Oceanicola sp. S124 TaxID=1042378 RepID=UPI0002558D5B|nr:DUF1217 domain-containing protein [Oceanicola sp. S124]
MFNPVLPLTGYAGWAFLERTYDAQRESFDKSPLITRDTAYFEENISKVKTAEDLVSDRRLLRVALGAFGLGDDIDNRYFIQKVLEDGTLKDDALALRLSDERYREFAEAFGFDRGTPSTQISSFGAEMTARFREQEFEIAVGDQDETMRFALNAKRVLGELAGEDNAVDTKWFKIMGNPPLREVFETAFGLPTSFGQIDLDQQLEVFKDRAEQILGSDDPADFDDEDLQDKLVRTYMLRDQLNAVTTTSSGMIAQTLLAGAISFMDRLRDR